VTFITAYTSARTVTGYQPAKIAPIHYPVNSKANIKGEKTEIRILFGLRFAVCSVKIRDISLSRTEPFGILDAAPEFGTV